MCVVGLEHCFPFVALFDLDIVVPPLDIQLREVPSSLKPMDQIVYEWEWVPIFLSYHIECTIVLDEAEFPILLLDEEDRCSDVRFGRADLSGGQSFV